MVLSDDINKTKLDKKSDSWCAYESSSLSSDCVTFFSSFQQFLQHRPIFELLTGVWELRPDTNPLLDRQEYSNTAAHK